MDCLRRQTRTFCLLKFVCLVDSYKVSISSQVKHTALEYIYARKIIEDPITIVNFKDLFCRKNS